MTRLRALVVLPTRDLVTQVRETFEAVGKGRGLKIGSVTGQHSFAHEQNQIIADSSKQFVFSIYIEDYRTHVFFAVFMVVRVKLTY